MATAKDPVCAMDVDTANPQWEERDFWHFSIGHVTPIIYSLMAERGYFIAEDSEVRAALYARLPTLREGESHAASARFAAATA